ncbi:hypothetical protein [Bacillus sp. FJAT-27245]|uniref:hypothetical protein n=1 Tax=Bacillus sp. FJAT-27245 TaxID=1684144 RepID=UPI000B0B25EF|nr:hypothetical protein [Bacillus sp. FJAT-27245]
MKHRKVTPEEWEKNREAQFQAFMIRFKKRIRRAHLSVVPDNAQSKMASKEAPKEK